MKATALASEPPLWPAGPPLQFGLDRGPDHRQARLIADAGRVDPGERVKAHRHGDIEIIEFRPAPTIVGAARNFIAFLLPDHTNVLRLLTGWCQACYVCTINTRETPMTRDFTKESTEQLKRDLRFHENDFGTASMHEECRRMYLIQEISAELQRRADNAANQLAHFRG